MTAKHFTVLVILVVSATTTEATMPVTVPIANISDPEIQSIGRFAINEYDKLGQSHLLFQVVFGGYVFFYPPATGHTLYLDLTAMNCSQFGALGNYTAQVFVLPLDNNTTYYFEGLKPKQT